MLLHHFLKEAQTGANQVSESKVGSCLSRLGSGIPFNFIRHLKCRMYTVAGCDLPISWAFPTVSGLAGMRVVHPAALLPAKDTWPVPGFLSSSLCPGLAFQGAAKTPLPKIFLRKGQATSSHLCQYLCFLLNPSVLDLEKSVQLNMQRVEPGVTLDHLDKATEPKESLGQSGYDVSSRILFKALWSVIEFRMVQCGFGFSLLFRIHSTHVIFGCS